VYRVRDTRLERDAALKILPATFSRDDRRLERFQREARATAALSRPNIVAIFDVGAFDGRPYLVTELIDGQTLRSQIASAQLSVARAAEIGAAIARGLAAAHGRGLLHRDLKPENVFITRGQIKILDCGLATLVEAADGLTMTIEAGTESGVVSFTASAEVSLTLAARGGAPRDSG
jgi:serine/threonine protein kinase